MDEQNGTKMCWICIIADFPLFDMLLDYLGFIIAL